MSFSLRRGWHFAISCVSAAVRFCLSVAIKIVVAWLVAVVLSSVSGQLVALARSQGFYVPHICRVIGPVCFRRSLWLVALLALARHDVVFCLRIVLGWVNWLFPNLHHESAYVEDCPLKGTDDDLLERKPFEDKVMDLIGNAPETDCAQYIGIWGPWGSGKTSVMRRVEYRMRHEGSWLRRPVFIRFDPLRHSGGCDLLGAMFEAMAESHWLRFYGVGGILGCVGSRLVASRILAAHSIRHWTFDCVRFVLSLFCAGVSLQDQLSRGLKKIGRRIVIVIDDLDRLPKDEMCAVVRMLKSVGDLPNVTYVILANEPYLAAGIGSMVPSVKPTELENGRDYLKKIVVNQMSLPEVEDEVMLVKMLRRLVGRDLRRFWFKFDIDNCDHLFFVKHFVANVRDVKRLSNSVRAALAGFSAKDNGVGVSVDIGDLIILEAVRMKWPDFHAALPRLFSEFLLHDGRIFPEGFVLECLALVPQEERGVAQLFLAEYLDVHRRQEMLGDPAKIQWCWRLNNPLDYKKYQDYRLGSEFCFDNYFVTGRSAKVVPRAHLETTFDYVESDNLDELVEKMFDMDRLSCLPELLFVLQNKYREASVPTAERLVRALTRLLESPLKSHKLKSHESILYGGLYAQIMRFAKELLTRLVEAKLSLGRIIELEPEATVLFAALLSEDADRAQKGETPMFVSGDDLPMLLSTMYQRMSNRWSSGMLIPAPGLQMAMENVCRSLEALGGIVGGLRQPRDWQGVEIPSIEIVIIGLGDARKFLDTLRSVLMSTNAYEGAVGHCVIVVNSDHSQGIVDVVESSAELWTGANIAIQDKFPVLTRPWVTFVREGDCVSREWFSLLAFESFHVSVDIVSYDYYRRILENVQLVWRKEIYNSKDISPYMKDLLFENPIASCFWNKMYKASLFAECKLLPVEEDELANVVVKCILASHKIAHVNKGLLCHSLNLNDAENYSRGLVLRPYRAGRRLIMLEKSEYAEVAFGEVIRSLDCCNAWAALFVRQFGGMKMIDALCPRVWRMRRIKMWMVSKIPIIRRVAFRRCAGE